MRLIEEIMKEINGVMDRFDEINLDQAMTLIKKETPVFVDGEGRSGFVARCFAMRLMHIGYTQQWRGASKTFPVAASRNKTSVFPGNLCSSSTAAFRRCSASERKFSASRFSPAFFEPFCSGTISSINNELSLSSRMENLPRTATHLSFAIREAYFW